jgi:hypothetical protein
VRPPEMLGPSDREEGASRRRRIHGIREPAARLNRRDVGHGHAKTPRMRRCFGWEPYRARRALTHEVVGLTASQFQGSRSCLEPSTSTLMQ